MADDPMQRTVSKLLHDYDQAHEEACRVTPTTPDDVTTIAWQIAEDPLSQCSVTALADAIAAALTTERLRAENAESNTIGVREAALREITTERTAREQAERERDEARRTKDASIQEIASVLRDCKHEADEVLCAENAALKAALEEKDPPTSEYPAPPGLAARFLWPMLRVWGEECQTRKMRLREAELALDTLRADHARLRQTLASHADQSLLDELAALRTVETEARHVHGRRGEDSGVCGLCRSLDALDALRAARKEPRDGKV